MLEELTAKVSQENDRLKIELKELKEKSDSTVKNLMSSITMLKAQNKQLEDLSKDNIRVQIINNLKLERRDQEIVIGLLRKYIGNNEELDKYLMKEFAKSIFISSRWRG